MSPSSQADDQRLDDIRPPSVSGSVGKADRSRRDAAGRKARPAPGHANTKLLAALNELVFQTIPAFRAKFGNGRFRLFFRYDAGARIIIFAWVNDDTTLPTHGAKNRRL